MCIQTIESQYKKSHPEATHNWNIKCIPALKSRTPTIVFQRSGYHSKISDQANIQAIFEFIVAISFDFIFTNLSYETVYNDKM